MPRQACAHELTCLTQQGAVTTEHDRQVDAAKGRWISRLVVRGQFRRDLAARGHHQSPHLSRGRNGLGLGGVDDEQDGPRHGSQVVTGERSL